MIKLVTTCLTIYEVRNLKSALKKHKNDHKEQVWKYTTIWLLFSRHKIQTCMKPVCTNDDRLWTLNLFIFNCNLLNFVMLSSSLIYLNNSIPGYDKSGNRYIVMDTTFNYIKTSIPYDCSYQSTYRGYRDRN